MHLKKKQESNIIRKERKKIQSKIYSQKFPDARKHYNKMKSRIIRLKPSEKKKKTCALRWTWSCVESAKFKSIVIKFLSKCWKKNYYFVEFLFYFLAEEYKKDAHATEKGRSMYHSVQHHSVPRHFSKDGRLWLFFMLPRPIDMPQPPPFLYTHP